MDRQKALRDMMKASNGQSSELTGKNKAKVLKMLKKKATSEVDEASLKTMQNNRKVQTVEDGNSVSKVIKTVKIVPIQPTAIPAQVKQSLLSTLGDYGEDDDDDEDNDNDDHRNVEDINIPSIIKAAPSKELIVPSVNVFNGFYDNDEELAKRENFESQIPQGFFDDPSIDREARGIDTKKLAEIKAKKAENDFKSFLSEIEEFPIDEVINPEDEEQRDAEESIIQMAYMTRVAKLMHTTEQLLSEKRLKTLKVDDISHDPIAREGAPMHVLAEAEALLSEMSEVITSNNDRESRHIKSSIKSDVESVIAKQREEKKKRKRETRSLVSTTSEVDLSMNFADWTAKSFI